MTNQVDTSDYQIKVGITQGDINGISYEIIMKALADNRIFELFTPVVYGSSKVASYHKKTLNNNDFNFNLIKKADLANSKRANIVNVFENEIKIDLGKPTAVAGEQAMLALNQATEDLKKNLIDVLVTAPINKKNMQSANFQFPGHTEYLANKFDAKNYLMLMICDRLRIGVITGHVPLTKVAGELSVELIMNKIKILHQSLIKDFGITKPKIALLGLNPHAGDQGALGAEEQSIIIPAIEKANQANMMVFGPYPADGFFGNAAYTKYDGILAMYHDQGMIPFKSLAFGSGVNFTAGLPIIRTSPAHGTAYDIAGQNLASEDSLRAALYLACDIFKNRMIYNQITANPLQKLVSRQTEDNA